ncbi:type I polyketide synthase [Nocardiopsis metallicus]|uniref:Acyl transferase domain-containing protein n=1 Tax=Nocardiopsis metallicus TaxID=179819 RepID=A0A840W9B3_9ACTN|nr:type I polyketide synthase [Nocardiopsis metallicus]MBB5491963.1 acyl transferase domain-containing protein [Nocardiopsis metallicus]
MTTTSLTQTREPMAIIGMGCRLPGGINDPDQLWKAVSQGRDHITRVPEDRWKAMVERMHPTQLPAAPFPAGIVDHGFDHAFFGITADEAAEMDPQQGWILEVAYEALADAGIAPSSLAGSRSGVYVGAASVDQAAKNFAPRNRAGVFTSSGAGMAILANRLSHALDLDGPSLTLDTACSSSLTALHYAVRDLRTDDVDLALVAGSNILTNPVITTSFTEAGVLAPDGRCKPFDQDADGYVRSEGAVVLVLTRADLAVERGHRVWAHVAGTGLSHGGRAPHLLAPRASRQAQAIRRALADAGVAAEQVGWVQAHGTGTKAGDRVEATGVSEGLEQDAPVPVGSVKSVLGHLEGAAGVLGVMAAALAVHHGQVPPTSHHHRLRAGLEGRIRVPIELEPWPYRTGDDGGRVAGVSGFGFGGSNAHALLAQAPVLESPEREDPMPLPETVFVSAHTPAALSAAAGHLAVNAPRGGSVGTVADTSLARGPHHRYRAAVTTADLGSLVQGLRALQDGTPDLHVVAPRSAPDTRPRVVFVYTGHGGHYPASGAELMCLPAFARAVEEARAALAQQSGYEVWAPGEAITSFVDAQHCTTLTQIGLTALLAQRGIEPDLVLGHSVGEIAAAHTAGVLDLEAATRVLARRSELLSGLSEVGGLLAIRASVDEVDTFTELYGGMVTIASYSAPAMQVVAGPTQDLDHLQTLLAKRDVWCKPVPDVIPAHSPLVEPLVPALREALAGLVHRPAQIPIVSTAHPDHPRDTVGLWGPAYWSEQARRPVRFTRALSAAASEDEGPVVFVEIGPRALLMEHVAHTHPQSATVAVTGDPYGLAQGIGELYTAGVTPTGPIGRTHPHLVIAPGWDHTGRAAPVDDGGALPMPAPDQVEAHLITEVSRLLPLLQDLDMDSTWIESGLESHGLLQLTSRLRRVPPWARVDVQVFLPDRTWRQVAAALVERLPDPHQPSPEGSPSVLP